MAKFDEPVFQGAVRNLNDAAFDVREEVFGLGTVTVGYQGRFRIKWAATKLHLFVIILPLISVDRALTARVHR
jgi:hypothetical protein